MATAKAPIGSGANADHEAKDFDPSHAATPKSDPRPTGENSLPHIAATERPAPPGVNRLMEGDCVQERLACTPQDVHDAQEISFDRDGLGCFSRWASPRYVYRWCNRNNATSWSKRLFQGYEMVRKGDLREGESFPDTVFNVEGLFAAGANLVLCRCPKERWITRRNLLRSHVLAKHVQALSTDPKVVKDGFITEAGLARVEEDALRSGRGGGIIDPRSGIRVRREVDQSTRRLFRMTDTH